MPRNSWRAWMAAAVVGGLCAAAPAADKPQVGVTFPTQVRLGNIFTAGEQVRLEAAVRSGSTVEWSVSDFEGRKVASGTARVVDGKVAIAPGADGKGFYLVRLTAKDGEKVTGQGSTSYAVVAPVDAAGTAEPKFGVMAHFAQGWKPDLVPLIAKAGIAIIRDEAAWQQVEKVRGQYELPDRVRQYMAALNEARVKQLMVLAFGNKLYDDQPKVPVWQLAPFTPAGYAGYASYCAAVLQAAPQIRHAEVWNEYNGSFCAGKAAADRPRHYAEMLHVAYDRIKSARPDTTVVGGAAVKIPLPYLAKLFDLGALQHMDAVAVHPYQPRPEGVERDVADLAALMRKHNQGKAKPIWVTECSLFGDETVERAGPASYLVRMYTLLLSRPETGPVFWYLMRDYGKQFHNLGLVHDEANPMGKYTPVMGYPAYSNLIHLLGGAAPGRREATDPRTRVYRFEKGRQTVWVCWSTAEPARLIFEARGPVELVNLVGGGQALTPADGRVALTAGDTPVYVVAEEGVVTAVREVPRPDRVLADAASDFAGEQGASGWGYFYYVSNKDGSAAYEPDKVRAMTWRATPGDWAYAWAGPGQWFIVGAENAHPSSVEGGQGWAVRRWTSGRAGPIRVRGQASRGANGDGSGVKVFLDGRELLSRMLPPKGSATIDLRADVRNGSRLDFVVTPGAGLDASYDSTTMRITILTAAQ